MLEAGLRQRVRALNLFAADVYAERRIVAAGVVPMDVIVTSELHAPEMRGVPMPACGPLAIVGLDIVRDEQGRFLVLEDNVRTPSGLAYAEAARDILDAYLQPSIRPASARRRVRAGCRRAALRGDHRRRL